MKSIGHNKNTFYLKILFITIACIILMLDLFSIINHGALCFLFFFSLFGIFYGITLLGLFDPLFLKIEEYIIYLNSKIFKKTESIVQEKKSIQKKKLTPTEKKIKIVIEDKNIKKTKPLLSEKNTKKIESILKKNSEKKTISTKTESLPKSKVLKKKSIKESAPKKSKSKKNMKIIKKKK